MSTFDTVVLYKKKIPDQVGDDDRIKPANDGMGVGDDEIILIFAPSRTVVESAGNETRSTFALPFWEAVPFTIILFLPSRPWRILK